MWGMTQSPENISRERREKSAKVDDVFKHRGVSEAAVGIVHCNRDSNHLWQKIGVGGVPCTDICGGNCRRSQVSRVIECRAIRINSKRVRTWRLRKRRCVAAIIIDNAIRVDDALKWRRRLLLDN